VATRTVPPGFTSNNVLTLETPVSGSRFGRTADVSALVQTAEQRVEALHDVGSVAVASSLPLEPGVALPFVIDRRPLLRSPYHGTAQWRRISRAYFDVFQIALQSGRLFTRHDIGGSLPIAIINEAMARKFWPGGSALNERIRIGREVGGRIEEPIRTIVGVVADVRDTGLNRDPEPMVYVPIAQVSDSLNAFHNQAQALQWVVRTNAAPNRLIPAIERELRASGRDLVIGRVRTMDEIVAQSTAQSDFNATVLTLFAAVSLILSATGLYGLMAHSIEQRTREIGIRIALGATPWRVRAVVLMEGLRLTLAGVFIGAVAAVWLTRYMAGLIYGVQTLDPMVFTAVAILLIAVATLGTLLSARRATSIQANVALRH
jgi:putative ABC transport system permease protein